MKKVLSAIAVMAVLCLLCSCNSTQTYTYMRQNNINANYNNISAGSGCWMDNNFLCSTDHRFGFDLYVTDNNGKVKVATLSYSYDAHLYGDKLYYYDVGLNATTYEFFEYDLKTKDRKTIATISSERIYNYYVVDNDLYIEVGDNDSLVRGIVSVSLDTDQRFAVARNVFLSGIVKGELNYLSQKDSKYRIYRYDAANQKSVLLGAFELEYPTDDGGLDGVNFHSEYIAFAYSDYETAKSKIYVYRYADDALVSRDFDGTITEFISYDRFAFFSADGAVYRFDFSDNSAKKLAELSADGGFLFVGSDDEVYVASMGFDDIRRYSVDGEYECVVLK